MSRHALLVGDDVHFRLDARRDLARRGYLVSTVRVDRGLRYLRLGRFDLCVVDVARSTRPGQVARRYRTAAESAGVPLLLCERPVPLPLHEER